FNILNSLTDLEDLYVLDLCAGIGGISFEFCSRGAAEVVAVDRYAPCVEFIRQQAATWQMENLRVLRQDVCDYLRQAAGGTARFDIIFADPPYDAPFIDSLPALVAASGLLKPGGRFILEHGKAHAFNLCPGFEQERHYGKVHFSFFRTPELK
ncbi:MAG: RsmD family RNA methyltransferase, partial [Bacteroidales bacterium]|nr:RsmD family RNA methyltransferase [Bacteroidales bacterium]